MSLTAEELYELLPAILRQRDLERGEPLRALFDVLAREGRVVEADIERLYDNLFIETCDPWVIPYLGDLLGVRGLNETGATGFSPRARVANTLAFRRRKGTATMLEQLALDVTGWRARAVEFFELLGTTQWLNHLRLHSLQTPDLRRGEALELIDTAFDSTRRFVDVRRIARARGRHNLPNIGIFLWRLQSYHLADLAARPASDGAAPDALGRFHIHPLAIDAPLFNRPTTEPEITTLATERNVPGALRRRALDAEVEARRLALVDSGAAPRTWFDRLPVFEIEYRLAAGDPLTRVKPEEMLIANLEAPAPALPEVWLRPPEKVSYVRASDGATVDLPITLALDPVLGRISFPAGVVPAEVRVSAAHGFPGDIGGGPYDRRESAAEFPLDQVTWQAAAGRDLTADPAQKLFTSFADAVADWNATAPAGVIGVLTLLDNGTSEHGGLTIELGEASRILIVSADWPLLPQPGGGTARELGHITASGVRAHVRGSLAVRSAAASELWLDGVLLEGDLALVNTGGAGLQRLRLAHTTIVPGKSLSVADAHEGLSIDVRRCITGAIELAGVVPEIAIRESIVDGAGAFALHATEADAVTIEASTLIGEVETQHLDASNSIFTAHVEVSRRQTGCVRFCFVPDGSLTPRRHRCQPELALAGAANAAEEQKILDRVVPDFTDEHFGAPAYLQLARTCPVEITTGADDGGEMGAWWFLHQPQREANLRASLDEYLRLGLEAGVLFAT